MSFKESANLFNTSCIRMFKLTQYAFLLMLIMLLYNPAYAGSDNIPNAWLRVAVQIKTEGKLEKGFQVLTLDCIDSGRCWLTSVSLKCFPGGSWKDAQHEDETEVFYPVAQRSSTQEGNLKVMNKGNSLVVQETGSDIVGDYTNNMRFDYEPTGKDKIVTRLTGFSGGYVKNSIIFKKVYTAEYVPLPKANQIVKLGCDPLLPGIDKR